ncbi:MAG: multiheme c-type cytochrome [Acidiferrobacterales bacterium]
MNKKLIVIGIAIVAITAFFGWRFVRPLNIFIVSEKFERPVSTVKIPAMFKTLRAEECGTCHQQFYKEWKTTIHAQAWTDPYFQTDWKFEGSQQICKNCHIPLDRQQEHKVIGFRDKDKWDPILQPNPDFDPVLQHEGVTCAACHLREGKILGVYGDTRAPHPVKKLQSGNEICVQCHVVSGERWDTFFRFPPCGTVAEIQAGRGEEVAHSGETVVGDPASLGCVGCHMPLVRRSLVAGGKVRNARQHLWRGGHDPEQVKRALDIRFEQASADGRRYLLTLTNVGAAHYVPTGTPDRHFTLNVRLLDKIGKTIMEKTHVIKRTVMWRPFIVDLKDNRLPPGKPRQHEFNFSKRELHTAVAVEAIVRYGLVDKKRLERIGYKGKEALSYEVFRKQLMLSELPTQRRQGAKNTKLTK